MFKFQFFFFLFLQTSLLFGQKQIQQFVQQNSHPLLTISPNSTNYEDLTIIGNAIGDARIVLMGEQDHGDASTYLAKTRLVKYLHEKKEFDVLAFESDFFGLNSGWDNLDKSRYKVVDTFLQNNVLSLWTFCSTCSHLLYNYIPSTQNTDTPLAVTGFDNQMNYMYSRAHLIENLDSVLRKADIAITKEINYQSEILPLLRTLITKFGYQLPSADFFEACGKTLHIIKSQWRIKLAGDDFWALLIDNLIAFNEEERNFKKDMWKAESIRDEQMFLNLKWLLQEKYANRKVIVWAANNHVAKYNTKKYTSMGKLLSLDVASSDKMYVIGFTSRMGKGGRLYENKYIINKPKTNSLESWLQDSFQYAFVDFAAYNNTYPNSKELFHMRGWKYWTLQNEWNKVYDGIFYIKEMYPCESITNNR